MDEKKPFVALDEDIQSKLDKKLGPEYISKRIGYGTSRVAYIEGWKAINLANQIFGYSGWSTEVKNVIIDFLDERQGKFSIGCTAIVRVTLTNGTYREDIGYGIVENERRKAAAFERAKKSAVTDALKRSLRAFGNALGNCLYDKDFLSKIDKVKFDPPDFDESNLFRPSDEISEISRANTIDPTDTNYPPLKKRQLNKIQNTNTTNNNYNNKNSSVRETNNKNTIPSKLTIKKEIIPENIQTDAQPVAMDDPDDLLDDSFMLSDDFQDEELAKIEMDKQMNYVPVNPPNANNQNEPVAFVTAKAAPALQNGKTIAQDNIFDPKFKAQSIRHTVDQSTSKHIPSTLLKERGIDSSRSSSYEQFAPKGKQIPNNNDDDSNRNINNNNANRNTNSENNNQPMYPTTTNNDPIMPKVNLPTNKYNNNNNLAPNNVERNDTNKVNNVSRFAPPVKPIHPNTLNRAPSTTPVNSNRREVGRPKIYPSNLKKNE